MSDTVILKFAETDYEWDEVANLIALRYKQEFRVNVSPTERQIIVVKDGDVIGTLGVEFAVRGKLPFQKSFTIHDEKFESVPKEELVEFTRWASRYPFAGMIAAFGASTYALKQGKRYVVACMKEKQAQYIEALGAKSSVLSTILKPSIPKSLVAYYTTPPQPQVVMADIENWQEVARKAGLESQGLDSKISLWD